MLSPRSPVTVTVSAVASVRAQTNRDWELLIVDDNDPDSPHGRQTALMVERLSAEEPRVRYLQHEENRGACAARNTGIAQARGDFLAFLDDDCAPDPDWLDALDRALAGLPGAVGAGGLPGQRQGAPGRAQSGRFTR